MASTMADNSAHRSGRAGDDPPDHRSGRDALADEPDVQFRSVRLSDGAQDARRGADGMQFDGGSTGGLRRDRPFSASVVSRRSTGSTKSRVSLNPRLITSELAARNMFCYRESAIELAVAECKKSVVQASVDGEVTGYWLLTEIDHWDIEKEKLVLLTTKSLLVVKYDFIALKPRLCTRVLLKLLRLIEIGDFTYPQYSVMPPRQHGGVRVHWGTVPPSLIQRWNPFCENVGFLTLTHHLLAYNEREKETVTFDVADLADSLIQATRAAQEGQVGGAGGGGGSGAHPVVSVEQRPIEIESYASMTSMVFNQSHIGFSMERGGISF